MVTMSSAGICEQPTKTFDEYVRDRIVNKRSDRRVKFDDLKHELKFAKHLCKQLVSVGVLTLEDVSLYFD